MLDSVSETRTHNSINELTARTVGEDPEIDLSYDAAGNLTQDGDSNGGHKYAWDYRNRLIEVQEKQSGNWNATAVYKYDARNRRVLKVVTNKGGLNGTTRFLWGGEGDWQCLEERDGSGDLVARFTYAPGYIDAVGVQERDLNSDDDFGDANEVVYYHQNTLFTVYALSDGNESVIERYRYDAYGACTVLDADGSADADGLSDVGNPYTFTGRRLDPESALMQYRNRYYCTGLGRFISRDPLAYVEAFNMFAYARGGVSGRVDPSGLASFTGIWDKYPQAKLTQAGSHAVKLPDGSSLVIEWAEWYSDKLHCPNCGHGEARVRQIRHVAVAPTWSCSNFHGPAGPRLPRRPCKVVPGVLVPMGAAEVRPCADMDLNVYQYAYARPASMADPTGLGWLWSIWCKAYCHALMAAGGFAGLGESQGTYEACVSACEMCPQLKSPCQEPESLDDCQDCRNPDDQPHWKCLGRCRACCTKTLPAVDWWQCPYYCKDVCKGLSKAR